MKYRNYINEDFFDNIQSDNIEVSQRDNTRSNDSYNDMLYLDIALLGEVTQFNTKKSFLKKLVEQTFKITRSCLDDIAVDISDNYEFILHPDTMTGKIQTIDVDSFVFKKNYENRNYGIIVYFQKNNYVSPMSAHRFTRKLMSLKKLTIEDGDVCYNVSDIKYYTSDLFKKEYYNVHGPDFFSIYLYKKPVANVSDNDEMNTVRNQIKAFHNYRLLNMGEEISYQQFLTEFKKYTGGNPAKRIAIQFKESNKNIYDLCYIGHFDKRLSYEDAERAIKQFHLFDPDLNEDIETSNSSTQSCVYYFNTVSKAITKETEDMEFVIKSCVINCGFSVYMTIRHNSGNPLSTFMIVPDKTYMLDDPAQYNIPDMIPVWFTDNIYTKEFGKDKWQLPSDDKGDVFRFLELLFDT